jgi:hypothetical protein
MPIAGDRMPQRYLEGYQHVEIQSIRQQEADAF